MPQQVLGIALEENHISAVRLTGYSRAYDVTLALRQPLPAHDDPEEQSRLQRETVQQLVETHGLRGDTVLASLPAHHAILRNLALPFRDLRRIRRMITFALDEHMPFEPENVVVDFRPLPVQQVPQQTQVLVPLHSDFDRLDWVSAIARQEGPLGRRALRGCAPVLACGAGVPGAPD